MRRLIAGICGFIVVLIATTACSKGSGSDDLDWHRMHEDTTREAFAKAFPILDLKGAEARPVAPDGKSPFAVVIMYRWEYLAGSYSYAFCSASHVGPGKAVTNAHCTEEIYDFENLYLVYYDKSGAKKSTKPVRINYQGSSSAIDVAVLELTPEVDAEWDMLTDSVATAAAATNKKITEASLAVTMWAFDPTETAVGHAAMAFHPRQCTASRKIPVVTGITSTGRRDTITFQYTDESIHMFLEACDAVSIQGNSGAIVTPKLSLHEPIGVNHWGCAVGTQQLKDYDQFEMVGANGKVPLDAKSNFIRWLDNGGKEEQRQAFAVGSVFDALLKKVPDAFTNHRERWEPVPPPEASPSPMP